MSLIFVGDPHVTAAELQDSQNLIDGICTLAYDHVVILGDLFHTHAVMNLEVMEFWQRAVIQLLEHSKNVSLLVGNHDMSTSGRGSHALMALTGVIDRSRIVDQPTMLAGNIVAIPYANSHEEFDRLQHAAADKIRGTKTPDRVTLVCHQTFQGAQYESGMYAPDGFPIDKLLFKKVISGHIHKKAHILGEDVSIRYVGSPRWRIASDANEDKSLLAYPDGMLGPEEEIPTSQWCRPIETIEDVDDNVDALSTRRWKHSRLTVTVRGTPERVRRRAAELQELGISVLPRPTSNAPLRVSETKQSVEKSFAEFLAAFRAPNATAGTRLSELILGYDGWRQ